MTHVELLTAPIERELESKIDRRLAEESDRSIGVAGRLNYTVDRGPIAVSVEGDALVVTTPVHARAEACARGRCYASCEPAAIVRAEVPLMLTPEYRFAASKVTVSFTRGCKVRALGGFLTIDVTPTIEAQLAPQLKRVQREIDRRLPKLRPQAEQLWSELSKVRPVPLAGCVVVQPLGIVQGPVTATSNSVRLRFALLAQPEIRTHCGPAVEAQPLPPLSRDLQLPADEAVNVGLVMPLTNAAAALRAVDALAVDEERTRIAQAAVSASGRALDVDLTLQGSLCGELAVRASPAWAKGGTELTLQAVTTAKAELARLEQAAIEPDELLRALSGTPRWSPPVAVERLHEVLPLLASSASDAAWSVSVDVAPARPAGAAARAEDLVAWVTLPGHLTLKQKER